MIFKAHFSKRSAWFARCPYQHETSYDKSPGVAPTPFDPIPTILGN